MNSNRWIPTRVFRVVAIILLLIAIGIWMRWLIQDSGPFDWLQQKLEFLGLRESQVLGALGAFVLVFVVWMIPTFVLRHFTDMPHLREEWMMIQDKSLRGIWQESMNAQRQKQAEMLSLPKHSPTRSKFFRQMGWVGIGVGLGAWLVTGIVWYLGKRIWQMGVAVGLVGVLGGLLSVVTGRPIMFDWPQAQKLKGIVNRLGCIITILALLFAAVMCVVQAFR
ncbi:MAG: hypothetical protein GY832_43640 [Chloroflexi bacterium]|nr:hypothetical protein [Chloroflexota bacterium]